jgi:acetyltransferase-like isoleucine patch superfamily enzyme
MNTQDKAVYWAGSLEYAIGTLIARVLIQKIGQGSRIHVSVKYWRPSSIVVGANCEIRHGTFLDARSKDHIGIRIDDGARIKDYVGLAAYNGEIRIGRNVLIGRCTTIHGHGGVYIGDDSMLGPHILIVSNNHLAYLNGTPFQEQGMTYEATHIGANVWIGGNACILAGSIIEPDVVVAAGAVVRGTLQSG